MHGRKARRATTRGFTLVELMVVVFLVAILALLATPMMRTAKDDRLTFNYAREIAQIFDRAGRRAGAHGAANLVVVDKVVGAQRGRIVVYEAHDTTDGAFMKECNRSAEWNGVDTWTPGTTLANALNVDGLDLNSAGINVDANIFVTQRFGTTNGVAVIAYCITPGGRVYAGSGSSIVNAVSAMQGSSAFNDTFDVTVQRHLPASTTGVGLARHVLVASTATPRIISN